MKEGGSEILDVSHISRKMDIVVLFKNDRTMYDISRVFQIDGCYGE